MLQGKTRKQLFLLYHIIEAKSKARTKKDPENMLHAEMQLGKCGVHAEQRQRQKSGESKVTGVYTPEYTLKRCMNCSNSCAEQVIGKEVTEARKASGVD